jgi:hypothetical protein
MQESKSNYRGNVGGGWGNKSSLSLSAIQSLIDDKRFVTADQWTLSLVKSKKKEHAFLLLEGKLKDEFVIFRTDLFLRKDTDKKLFGQDLPKGSVLDSLFEFSASSKGHAFVKVSQLSVKSYDEILVDTEFQGWCLNAEQAEKLLKRLQSEGLKEFNYHGGGDSKVLSVSDSRSTRTNCIKWCEKILTEVLGITLMKNSWHPVIMPSSRVELIKKFTEANRQQQLASARSDSPVSSLDPRAQRQEARARMMMETQNRYFQPVDNTNAPNSLVDQSYKVRMGHLLVSFAKGKIAQTKDCAYLMVETVEQQYCTIRRIDLVKAVPMSKISAQQQQNSTIVEILSMADEYTIETVRISTDQGTMLLAIIEEEDRRRFNPMSVESNKGLRMFDKGLPNKDNTVSSAALLNFSILLKDCLESIGVHILPKDFTL